MNRDHSGRWRAIALAAALLAGSVPAQAHAGPPREVRAEEITGTAVGRRAAEAAAERIRERYGIETSADELTVWAVGERRIIGPRGSSISVREVVRRNGTLDLVVEATEGGADAAAAGAAAADGAGDGAAADPSALGPDALAIQDLGWQLVGDHCWIDEPRGSTWMDVCYHKLRATRDGSAAHDYYALQMFSTFAAPGLGLEIGDPWIESRPAADGAAHAWFDWSPRADSTRNCENPRLSVSVNGFSLSLPALQCETWDITKYGAAGQFRNKWTEGICQQQKGERELAFEVVSRVSQGATPKWVFAWREHVQMASCAA